MTPRVEVLEVWLFHTGRSWHVRLNPARLGSNINQACQPIMAWCETQWGQRGMRWERYASEFSFQTREQAMLFKLAWHGVEVG